MKKIFFFLSAIALLGLTAACVEQMEVNPNYNPETREVNANFVFNIATSSSPVTKQSAADVQAAVTQSSLFRGIDNGLVLAFTQQNGDGKIVSAEISADKSYNLPTIVGANALAGTGNDVEDKSRRVLELSIPTGTNTFLVYGKAIKTGTNNAQGAVDFQTNADLSKVAFSLTQRFDDSKTQTVKNVETIITTVLKNIVTVPTTTVGTKTLHWYDYATFTANAPGYQYGEWVVVKKGPANPDVATSPLAEILGQNIAKFLNIKTGAVRAGSGQSVARQIGDMVVSIGTVAKATSTSTEEATAIAMAKAIIDEMDKYFTTGKGSNNDYSSVTNDSDDVKWRPASDIQTALQTSLQGVDDGDIKHFPTKFDLPMGAAQLLISPGESGTGIEFAYHSGDIKPFGGAASENGFSTKKIMYPAELCYFGNSPIRVSDKAFEKNQYPDGAGNESGMWLNSNSWSNDWSDRGAHVLSSTRSIAMADNINYGTAMLETTIGYDPTMTATNGLQDNRKTLTGDETNNMFNPTASPQSGPLFYLTGILIGGQYKTMGWNYIAKDVSGDNKDFIVYDEICDALKSDGTPNTADAIEVPRIQNGTSKSIPNYTLVWDNYNGTTNQDPVYVALEFINNTGQDFWGEKNVIRKDGVFYIVGKLAIPATTGDVTTGGVTWPAAPDYYVIPPYNTDGTSKKVTRIFIQDYKTTAHFILNQTSLQHAYVTVPDLRSSQMSLGLSVDLEWRQGLSMDVVLGQTTTTSGTTGGN